MTTRWATIWATGVLVLAVVGRCLAGCPPKCFSVEGEVRKVVRESCLETLIRLRVGHRFNGYITASTTCEDHNGDLMDCNLIEVGDQVLLSAHNQDNAIQKEGHINGIVDQSK